MKQKKGKFIFRKFRVPEDELLTMKFPNELPLFTLRPQLTRNSQHGLAITSRGVSNSVFMHLLPHNCDEAYLSIVTKLRQIYIKNLRHSCAEANR